MGEPPHPPRRDDAPPAEESPAASNPPGGRSSTLNPAAPSFTPSCGAGTSRSPEGICFSISSSDSEEEEEEAVLWSTPRASAKGKEPLVAGVAAPSSRRSAPSAHGFMADARRAAPRHPTQTRPSPRAPAAVARGVTLPQVDSSRPSTRASPTAGVGHAASAWATLGAGRPAVPHPLVDGDGFQLVTSKRRTRADRVKRPLIIGDSNVIQISVPRG